MLDRSQLEALDKILNEEWSRFEDEYNRTLMEAVEKTFIVERAHSWNNQKSNDTLRAELKSSLEKSFQFRKGRQLAITLKNGSIAKVSDFSTAFREADLLDKDPSGFVATLESASRKCYVTLSGRYASLEVEVEPKGDHFVQQTLTILKNWQNSVRPSLWQLLWHKWAFLIWLLWTISVFISTQIIDQQRNTFSKFDYKQQAIFMLTNGVSSNQQGKAIELLLANAYNLSPTKAPYVLPHWFYLVLFGGFAYCIAISFKPNVAIAIGRGEWMVRFWRAYSKFILITTPTFIFLTFFWPKIEAVLKGWL